MPLFSVPSSTLSLNLIDHSSAAINDSSAAINLRGKKEEEDDVSSAGSSGWESSKGESSSTNTGSVESFDPNLENLDVGSSTISRSEDEYDDLEDRELLPAVINRAVNPVVQRGLVSISFVLYSKIFLQSHHLSFASSISFFFSVMMVSVEEEEDEDSSYMSDGSQSSASFSKRCDAAPMGSIQRSRAGAD
jgi:hypothetical protein